VVAVADQNKRVAFFGELNRFHVNLGYQGAGRVNNAQATVLAGIAYFR
jgi:hypothetical protein